MIAVKMDIFLMGFVAAEGARGRGSVVLQSVEKVERAY